KGDRVVSVGTCGAELDDALGDGDAHGGRRVAGTPGDLEERANDTDDAMVGGDGERAGGVGRDLKRGATAMEPDATRAAGEDAGKGSACVEDDERAVGQGQFAALGDAGGERVGPAGGPEKE